MGWCLGRCYVDRFARMDCGIRHSDVTARLHQYDSAHDRLRNLAGHRSFQGACQLADVSYKQGHNSVAAGNGNWNRRRGIGSSGRAQRFSAGADLKVGVTPSLRLTAAVNPDFGQVEADPSVVNLSAFETFFNEQRPFFVEGQGRYAFNLNCSAVNCNGEGLFYSRRIGRAPQLLGSYGDASSPTATTIFGAAKLSGRVGKAFSVGVLDAVTEQATGSLGRTIEPATNYGVARIQRDFRDGASNIGIIVTSVDRAA